MNINSGIINSPQKIVIYGPEGIGKSTIASKFPNPLFTDTEGSTKRLNVNRFDKPTSEEMIIQQIEYVKSNPSICKTYVIDTADWLEKLCSQSVCSKYKKSGIEDFGYGKGYTYLLETFGRILNKLEDVINVGINVVITAHATMRKFEQPDEAGAYDRWELKLDKRTGPMLKEWADAVFFINYKTIVEKSSDNKYKASGGKRVMYTEHNPCWDAKNRYGLPPETDFDYSIIAPFVTGSNSIDLSSEKQQTDNKDPMAELNNIVDEDTSLTKSSPNNNQISSDIPKELAQLMQTNDVAEEDIQLVVSQKGYFPIETKIKDYGEDFINGWIIAFWNKILEMISANKDLPFE